MSRQEKYARAGAKPQVSPATIQEDLRGRDFTCNAIALSLNRASRGLLLDPMNGLADIERKELRAVSTYGFYDDPSRLLRLVRFRVRLGYTVEERTQMQVANAREAEVEKHIPARALGDELKRISAEDSPTEIFKGLEEAGLLALFSPALLDQAERCRAWRNTRRPSAYCPTMRAGAPPASGPSSTASPKSSRPRRKQALIKATELPKADVDQWQKLEARAKKLEAALRAPRVRKPSHVYHIVAAAAPEDVLFVLYHSALKPVQERLRNHFQKYLPTVQEITPEEWATIEPKPGTPKYAKARDEFISEILNRRPKKPVEEEAPPTAAAGPGTRDGQARQVAEPSLSKETRVRVSVCRWRPASARWRASEDCESDSGMSPSCPLRMLGRDSRWCEIRVESSGLPPGGRCCARSCRSLPVAWARHCAAVPATQWRVRHSGPRADGGRHRREFRRSRHRGCGPCRYPVRAGAG